MKYIWNEKTTKIVKTIEYKGEEEEEEEIPSLLCCVFAPTRECEMIGLSYDNSLFIYSQLNYNEHGLEVSATLMDVEEEEMEDWENDQLDLEFAHCSYPMGYQDQCVYICLTCQSQNGLYGGMCAQCSRFCHELNGHEIYNIGIKKKFRCDCGNSKFPSNIFKSTHKLYR